VKKDKMKKFGVNVGTRKKEEYFDMCRLKTLKDGIKTSKRKNKINISFKENPIGCLTESNKFNPINEDVEMEPLSNLKINQISFKKDILSSLTYKSFEISKKANNFNGLNYEKVFNVLYFRKKLKFFGKICQQKTTKLC
jgi:hypothetical protein